MLPRSFALDLIASLQITKRLSRSYAAAFVRHDCEAMAVDSAMAWDELGEFGEHGHFVGRLSI